MANRPSTVDRLPAEIRASIGRLREHGKTLDEILAHLREMEVEISRSALGRHVKGMAAMGERLRRSRAMAEGLARELGDATGEQMARVNIELMHSVLNDLLADSDEEGSPLAVLVKNPKGAGQLATAIEKLTKASRHNLEFAQQIEKRAKEAAQRQAAAAVDQVGRTRGLTAETIAAMKAEIFGVKPS